MKPLTYCETPTCYTPITDTHVFKTVEIRGDSQFLALLYKCPLCGRKNKIIGTYDAWGAYLEEARIESFERSVVLKEAQLELEYVDCVDDVLKIWASYRRPPIVETLSRCYCDSCRKRDLVEG